jgi:hypothetical protein
MIRVVLGYGMKFMIHSRWLVVSEQPGSFVNVMWGCLLF